MKVLDRSRGSVDTRDTIHEIILGIPHESLASIEEIRNALNLSSTTEVFEYSVSFLNYILERMKKERLDLALVDGNRIVDRVVTQER